MPRRRGEAALGELQRGEGVMRGVDLAELPPTSCLACASPGLPFLEDFCFSRLLLLEDLRLRVMSPSWHCGSRHCSGHAVVDHVEPVVGSSPACLRFDRDQLKRSDVAATRPLASIHGPSLRGLARTAWLEPEGYSAFDTISDSPVATSWLAF